MGSAGEMERRALKGQGVDLAWVKRSETEWFLYDLDREGTYEVMLFKAPGGGPVEGYRRDAQGAVVRAACVVAEALGLCIVAEGVETEAQAAEVEQLGCTHLQG